MESTVANIFGLTKLNHNPTAKLDWVSKYPRQLDFTPVDKSSLVGIEVEVEGISNVHCLRPSPFWTPTEDGSLKLNGAEYISTPISGSHVEYALQILFEDLKKSNEYFFSPRCSVHVHVNVRNMTINEVKMFCALYLLFERGLFSFVGENRDKNIHCVPLLDSNITAAGLFNCLDRRRPQHWMKYTALNIIPMADKGTVEFRHMHGTDDLKKLMQWIGMLLSMKNYVRRAKWDETQAQILNLNTNSEYYQLFTSVFKDYAPYLQKKEMLDGMEEGCTKVKQCLEGGMFLSTIRKLNPETKLAKLTGTSGMTMKRGGKTQLFTMPPFPDGGVAVEAVNFWTQQLQAANAIHAVDFDVESLLTNQPEQD
jgi:hypothetical protein